MTVGIFIDGQNIYQNHKQKIDWKDFVEWIKDGRTATVVQYFDASERQHKKTQDFYKYLSSQGIIYFVKTIKHLKNGKLKQSGVDVMLACKALLHAHKYNTFILVSGDSDFSPLIYELRAMGKTAEIVSPKDNLHPEYLNYGIKIRYFEEYLMEAKQCTITKH